MAISGVRVRVIFQYGKDSEVEQWYVPARVNYLLLMYDVGYCAMLYGSGDISSM